MPRMVKLVVVFFILACGSIGGQDVGESLNNDVTVSHG